MTCRRSSQLQFSYRVFWEALLAFSWVLEKLCDKDISFLLSRVSGLQHLRLLTQCEWGKLMLFVCLVVVVELPEQREGDRLGNRAFLHFFFPWRKKFQVAGCSLLFFLSRWSWLFRRDWSKSKLLIQELRWIQPDLLCSKFPLSTVKNFSSPLWVTFAWVKQAVKLIYLLLFFFLHCSFVS